MPQDKAVDKPLPASDSPSVACENEPWAIDENRGNTMQVSEDGRSVRLNVEFRFESDGSIRLTSEADPTLRVIIKNDPERPSGHPMLFKRLAQCLRIMGVPEPTA
jgi:hypothetical protein